MRKTLFPRREKAIIAQRRRSQGKQNTSPQLILKLKIALFPHVLGLFDEFPPCLLPAAGTRDRGLRGVGIPVPEPDMSVETDGSLRFPSAPRRLGVSCNVSLSSRPPR
jgi:hypothetical protein